MGVTSTQNFISNLIQYLMGECITYLSISRNVDDIVIIYMMSLDRSV